MEHKALAHKKKHGIYYTPSDLAAFLASRLIKRSDMTILDPACGEGALLLSARAASLKAFGTRSKIRLYGYDTASTWNQSEAKTPFDFTQTDFLTYKDGRKFDSILMNPPFVRSHRISTSKRNEYNKAVRDVLHLSWPSDLWAYFLIKASMHLKCGGSIGAILPWSLLQAAYARKARSWLATMFEKISVVALANEFFDNVDEKIVLVWLENYGERARTIRISFSSHLNADLPFQKLQPGEWTADRVLFSLKSSEIIEQLLVKHVDLLGFNRLGHFAEVHTGVVTGANRFFIVGEPEIEKWNLAPKHLVPILTRNNDLCALQLDGELPQRWLLKISGKEAERYKHYLLEGKRAKMHSRVYLGRRNCWYSVDAGKMPDAFVNYRTSGTAFMVLNNGLMQSTNSIHRIYFAGLTENEKKWVQVSLLSKAGQLSVEAYSKVYGSGVLKIEPKALKNVIVASTSRPFPVNKYTKLSRLVSARKFDDAVELSTEIVNSEFNVPGHLASETAIAHQELRGRRKL